MKHFILLILILLGSWKLTTAQNPEPVYSFARVLKPNSWYADQIKAWHEVVKAEPQNVQAWWYYYYANRNFLKTDTTQKRSEAEITKALDKVLLEMEKQIPNSYEYNLCVYKTHSLDTSYKKYLDRAMELGEDRIEHVDYVMNSGEINRNLALRDKGALQSFKAGLQSPGMMYYNRNVLAGLDENAILFTVGDNDTYPIWVVQALGYRKDVTAINTSLIMIDEYRARLFKELGIPEISSKSYPNLNFGQAIVVHVAKHTKQTVYIGLTALRQVHSAHLDDRLYITGLAYQYCEHNLDEKALLKRNFEQRYALDYLQDAYYQETSPNLVKLISQNYIVPLIKLYKHYRLSGNQLQADITRKLVLSVSKGTQSEDEVKELLD